MLPNKTVQLSALDMLYLTVSVCFFIAAVVNVVTWMREEGLGR